MQLSFLEEMPEVNKKFFLDIYAEAHFDVKTEKMKLVTIDGQKVPEALSVSIPSKFIAEYPEGTIYKLDTRLIKKNGTKPYFMAIKQKSIQRAIEFFDYNLKVQYGFNFGLN